MSQCIVTEFHDRKRRCNEHAAEIEVFKRAKRASDELKECTKGASDELQEDYNRHVEEIGDLRERLGHKR